MPCWKPLTGYYSKVFGKNGKRLITFSRGASLTGVGIPIPCGRCTGCRLEHSRQWAMRCLHEKRQHKDSCFVTLTYDNEHLPANGSLVKRDFTLFIKQVRNRYGKGLRFYAAGEYGDTTGRPHYHIIFFGLDFADKRFYKRAKDGKSELYTSLELDNLWRFGLAVIGNVTFDSCAYVARYIMKKVTGDKARAHYEFVDSDGVVHDRVPEYTTMSKGLGREWFDRHKKESYAHDNCIIEGKPAGLPRYYDNRYELENREHLIALKKARKRKARLQWSEGLIDRRRVREKVQILSLRHFKREL